MKMKNKISGLMVAGVAVFALSGCGSSGGSGGGGSYIPPDTTTLLLVDGFSDGVDGVRYVCDSFSGITGDGPLAGEFTFLPGDNCNFYLEDYVVLGDDLFITDDIKVGINNKYYICDSGIDGYTGDTGFGGEFIYNYGFNDVCTFEF